MTKKKMFTVLISGLVLLSVLVSALAAEPSEEINIPVTANREVAVFSVTLPTSFPADIGADGTVTVATDAQIINESGAPICVSKISVRSNDNWKIMPYVADAKSSAYGVGDKLFAMQFSLSHADGASLITCKTKAEKMADEVLYTAGSQLSRNEIIKRGETIAVNYAINLPLRDENMQAVNIADVVFTIAWAPQQTSFTK